MGRPEPVVVGLSAAMKRRSTSWSRSSTTALPEAENAADHDHRKSARRNARQHHIPSAFSATYLYFSFSLDVRSAYFSCEVSANAASRVDGVSSYGTGSANWLTVKSHFFPSTRL